MRVSVDLAGFFVMGLLGGFGHCIGMCAPFVLYLNHRFAPHAACRPWWQQAQLGYHLGRLSTYTVLGAMAGALGQTVNLAGELAGVGRIAGILAGVALLLYGVSGLLGGFAPAVRLGAKFSAALGARLRAYAPSSAYITGVLLGFLPCGLLYAAVLAGTATGGALRGGLSLALFALGTVPALLALAWLDARWLAQRQLLHRLSLLFVMAMGLLFLFQSV